MTAGKEVIELSVVATDKGARRRRAAHPAVGQRGASSSATTSPTRTRSRNLHGPDVGIKIGRATTPWRRTAVADPPTAVRALALPDRVPAALALRRAGGADRAAHDAGQRAHRGAAHPGGQGDLAVPPAAGLAGRLRRPARRRLGRVLLGRAGRHGRRLAAAGPALPARHDDRGDPLVRADRHRLARRRRPGHHRWSGCCPARCRCRVEFAPRPEFGQVPIQLAAGRRRAAGARLQRADRAGRPRRRVGDRRRRRRTTPRTRVVDLARAGGTVTLELRLGGDAHAPATAGDPVRRAAATGRPRPSSRGGDWAATLQLPDRGPRPGAAQRADPARRCATSRPARSWPPAPRRCPRRSAACATGTTATAGCATPR